MKKFEKSGTKPPGRGQETPQGEHEVVRTYKLQTLRYAEFKNGQPGEENRRPTKLLTQALQPDEFLSFENARKNVQMENIFQSQKNQSTKLKKHIMEIEEQQQQKIQFLGKRSKKNVITAIAKDICIRTT